MFELIGALSRDVGTSFVVVTHDLELAGRMEPARTMALRDGRPLKPDRQAHKGDRRSEARRC
jgi:predicted ABC-type transport system involved in lysophospholipase L1 biosynthesis ATPase subunit